MTAGTDERAGRSQLTAAVRRLDQLGLNHNASGNASVRVGDQLLVTPSGIPSADLTDDDLVLLDLDGRPARDGQRTATSEWHLHTLLARRRPDVSAVVHTHSPEATAASALAEVLPVVHYVVARFGSGGLRRAPYATYGTEELAVNVADTLNGDGDACLMANHGAIALGADLDAAVALALDVEWYCTVVRRARQQGTPTVLDGDEIDRVAERFRTYGQPRSHPQDATAPTGAPEEG